MTAISPEDADSVALVTVILPAYNHAKYVVEAMDSVRAQTFTRWELIVIDDGSTDDTWAVLQAYAAQHGDPRIRLLTQANAGSHATLNRGLAMARTPYLAILNSDDRYAPERLQRLVDTAQAAADEVFIVTGLRLIDGDGNFFPESYWWNAMYGDILQRWRAAQSSGVNPALQTLLWGNFTVSTSNFFMSRTLWQRLGPFKRLRYVPDWDYALRVAMEQPRAFQFLHDQALLEYRLHGRNTILGGALRNHAEAYHVLRTYQKKWAAAGQALPEHALDRLHYLARFIRHEHARQQLERQKLGWLEQVDALRLELDSARAAAEQWQATAQSMQASRSWRLTVPLRQLAQVLRACRTAPRAVLRKLAARWRRVQSGGVKTAYEQWLKAEASQLQGLHARASMLINELSRRPLISIVMPVHDTPPH